MDLKNLLFALIFVATRLMPHKRKNSQKSELLCYLHCKACMNNGINSLLYCWCSFKSSHLNFFAGTLQVR